MPRLTITLSEERHQALKETAYKQGVTIRQVIEDSLDFYGVKSINQAKKYLEQARQNSQLTEAEATTLALEATQAVRNQHSDV